MLHDFNEYPLHTINRTIQTSKMVQSTKIKNQLHSVLFLPYKGDRGDKLLNSLRQTVNENGDINLQVAYTGNKLKSEFKVKDSPDFAQTHNVVHKAVCPNRNCKRSFIGKNG